MTNEIVTGLPHSRPFDRRPDRRISFSRLKRRAPSAVCSTGNNCRCIFRPGTLPNRLSTLVGGRWRVQLKSSQNHRRERANNRIRLIRAKQLEVRFRKHLPPPDGLPHPEAVSDDGVNDTSEFRQIGNTYASYPTSLSILNRAMSLYIDGGSYLGCTTRSTIRRSQRPTARPAVKLPKRAQRAEPLRREKRHCNIFFYISRVCTDRYNFRFYCRYIIT